MKIYLVGGAVRDTLLNYTFTEKDWVVVGSSPEEMVAEGYRPVGKDFPVFLHPITSEEYALARTERKVAPGYKGFTFHTDPSITLEEDLERRDLTINAMAMDTNGIVIDPYGGQQDLTKKQLRHVSSAFNEDPVRILRVARFAARYHHLGFTVAEETLQLMHSMTTSGETQHLVAERVWQEYQKALEEQHPHIFFEVLQQCQALKDTIGFDDTDILHAANKYLNESTKHEASSLIRFATWCYTIDLENINAICKKLTVPNAYHDLAIFTKQYFSIISDSKNLNAEILSTLFIKTDALRKPERFSELLQACECIHLANSDTVFIQKEQLLEALNIFKGVNAQELMAQGFQGKELGEALQRARIEKLELWLESL